MSNKTVNLHFKLNKDNNEYKVININLNENDDIIENLIKLGINKYNNLYSNHKISENIYNYVVKPFNSNINNETYIIGIDTNLKTLNESEYFIFYKNEFVNDNSK